MSTQEHSYNLEMSNLQCDYACWTFETDKLHPGAFRLRLSDGDKLLTSNNLYLAMNYESGELQLSVNGTWWIVSEVNNQEHRLIKIAARDIPW